MKIDKHNFSFFNITLFILILIYISKISKGEECSRIKPMRLSDGTCILRYCSQKEIDEKTCFIDNQIVKSQYLNNLMILYKADNPSFVDIIKNDNGNIILEFTDKQKAIRKFFGLKSNGNYLYGDEKKMTDESFIYIKDNQNHKVNEINFMIVKDERNKEYLVSSIWDFSYNYYFLKYMT